MQPVVEGARYGRLVVLRRGECAGQRERLWICRCDCGTERAVARGALKAGYTRSCGCLRRALASERQRTHGLSNTPEYFAWHDARDRCHNPAHESFARYGGRGIVVCAEWRDDVRAFYRDIGPRPSRRHMLERVDNDGPYAPENCVWALPKAQARNRCNNHWITFDGVTLTLPEWAERVGIKPATLSSRLMTWKWTIERALTEPLRLNQHR